MKVIPLSQGLFTFVDDEDYANLNQYTWTADVRKHTIYAYRVVGQTSIYMHRYIMNPPNNMVVDHKNGNGLDNRKDNLQVITQMHNTQKSFRPNKTSRYLGVYAVKDKWRARVNHNGKRVQVGIFDDEIIAALAYNAAARELIGADAILNEVEV